MRGRAPWASAAVRGAFLLAAVGLAGCRTGGARPPEATSPAAAPAAAKVHEGLNATLWLQSAAEYRASTLQAFRTAREHLGRALEDPTWTAALEQTGDFAALPPAIILDMDEAIIRSDRFQAKLVTTGKPFRPEDWDAWVRTETSEPIAGALEYVREAHGRGVKIFYVTNRTANVEAESLATLEKLGFPVEAGLEDLLTQDERPEWGADKSSRRAYLCRTHRILQIVGDNLNDFTTGARSTPAERAALVERHADYWGGRWIVTPNPAYGGWASAIQDFDYALPREEVLRRKYRRLRPAR